MSFGVFPPFGFQASGPSPVLQQVRFGHASAPASPHFGQDEIRFGLPSNLLTLERGGRPPLSLRVWQPVGEESVPTTLAQAVPKDRDVMLLVHGLSGETAWLGPYVQALRAEHPDMSFVAVDLPEVGHSINQPGVGGFSRKTVQKVSDTIQALSRQAGRPIFVSGISLGGMVSTRAAARNKKHVAGLALVSPAFSPSRQLTATSLEKLTGKALLKAPPAAGLAAGFSAGLTEEQRAVRIAKEQRERTKELDKVSNLKILLNMQFAKFWDVFRLNPPLPGFIKRLLRIKTVPVISFATERDEVVSFNAVRRFMRRLRSSHTFKAYSQSAHNLSLDPQLPDMANRIGQWLNVHRTL